MPSALKDEKSVEHAISLLENETSNGTCTKWYKKYTSPGSAYYHKCCKDEGNNFCEEHVKTNGGRVAGYVLGPIYVLGVIEMVGLCCYATRCCRDDNSAEKVIAIAMCSVLAPCVFEGLFEHTGPNPPAAPVETPSDSDTEPLRPPDVPRIPTQPRRILITSLGMVRVKDHNEMGVM